MDNDERLKHGGRRVLLLLLLLLGVLATLAALAGCVVAERYMTLQIAADQYQIDTLPAALH